MTQTDAGRDAVQAAVAYLRSRLPFDPRVGVVLGSGFGSYAERRPAKLALAYAEIPGFPRCTVEGHRGRLLCHEGAGARAVVLQGRVHRYEGRSLEEVTRPVRVLAALGIDTVILSCAAGSVSGLPVGSVMLVEDHLNLLGDNPLSGRRLEGAGADGFVELADAYDADLLSLAEAAAAEAGARTQRGVLACVPGPTYETSAEAAMLRGLGAHAVSMSTVPEVIMARALGLRVLAFALITNESGVAMRASATHRAVLAAADRTADAVADFLDRVLGRLAS